MAVGHSVDPGADNDMTEPSGYCPCCGKPRINGRIIHDEECLWYGEDDYKEQYDRSGQDGDKLYNDLVI